MLGAGARGMPELDSRGAGAGARDAGAGARGARSRPARPAVPLAGAQLPRAALPGPDTRALGAAAPRGSWRLKLFLPGPRAALACPGPAEPPPGGTSPSAPDLASQQRCSSVFSMAVEALQGFSCFRPAPHCVQHSRCGPCSAE